MLKLSCKAPFKCPGAGISSGSGSVSQKTMTTADFRELLTCGSVYSGIERLRLDLIGKDPDVE
jgi:hypothetical protein